MTNFFEDSLKLDRATFYTIFWYMPYDKFAILIHENKLLKNKFLEMDLYLPKKLLIEDTLETLRTQEITPEELQDAKNEFLAVVSQLIEEHFITFDSVDYSDFENLPLSHLFYAFNQMKNGEILSFLITHPKTIAKFPDLPLHPARKEMIQDLLNETPTIDMINEKVMNLFSK